MSATNNVTYLKLARLWLVGILVFLPFQFYIADLFSARRGRQATIIYYLDEITVVVFLLLAFWEYVKNRKFIHENLYLFASSLVLISICGIISSFLNGNSWFVTMLGSFDYIKNFLVIFIYATFFRDIPDLKKIIRVLLSIAVCFGIIAFIQFAWAMGSVYILGKSITDKSVYIFSNLKVYDALPVKNISWRYGIFRVDAVFAGAYILGLFNLLMLTVYLFTAKKVQLKIFIPLISGIIASAVRMAYGGLIFILLLRFLKARKLIIFVLISIIVITAFLVISGDFSLSAILHSYLPENVEGIDGNNVRMYSRFKAMEIWRDHPFWGVGPGMFGGVVASKYGSYVYDLYHLANKNYITRVGGIEQFWFQLPTEMGLVGALCFINIIIVLIGTLYELKKRTKLEEIRNIFSALIAFIPCIFIYNLGSGINIASVLFTYCALMGVALGSLSNQDNNIKGA